MTVVLRLDRPACFRVAADLPWRLWFCHRPRLTRGGDAGSAACRQRPRQDDRRRGCRARCLALRRSTHGYRWFALIRVAAARPAVSMYKGLRWTSAVENAPSMRTAICRASSSGPSIPASPMTQSEPSFNARLVARTNLHGGVARSRGELSGRSQKSTSLPFRVPRRLSQVLEATLSPAVGRLSP